MHPYKHFQLTWKHQLSGLWGKSVWMWTSVPRMCWRGNCSFSRQPSSNHRGRASLSYVWLWLQLILFDLFTPIREDHHRWDRHLSASSADAQVATLHHPAGSRVIQRIDQVRTHQNTQFGKLWMNIQNLPVTFCVNQSKTGATAECGHQSFHVRTVTAAWLVVGNTVGTLIWT